MQVVIPMCGKGRRFRDFGFREPKPLIEVDGRPMIQHVVDLFPGVERVVFVCSETHLATTTMGDILARAAPGGEVVGLPDHDLGPVFSVSKVLDRLDRDDEVVVNYCDFSTLWDFAHFRGHVHAAGADGAIVAYRGFHPHMLGTTNYAFLRTSDAGAVLEVREKRPFTDDRMQEFASNGTYYFRTGSILEESVRRLLAGPPHENGEYYVSLLYNEMILQGRSVIAYETDYMLQWGTPEDLLHYQGWSDLFRSDGDAWRREMVPDLRVRDYWRRFFTHCPWHPYAGE